MELILIAIFFATFVLIILYFVIWYSRLPFAPQHLHGDWKDDRVVLTWQTVEDADEYEVFFRSGGLHRADQWTSLTSTRDPIAEINIITGVYYDAYVIAKNWIGLGKRSAIIHGCARATAPTQLTAVCDPNKPSISLIWSLVSCSRGYTIKRKAMTGNEFRAIRTVNSSSTTQMQDTSIIYGVNYTYMIVSLDYSGESASSQPTIVRPRVPPPSHFAASTPKDRSAAILLSWQPVPDSIAYHIYRCRTEDSTAQSSMPLVILRNSKTNSHLDQSAMNKVKYTYTIACEDAAGVSTPSISVIGIAALTAPNNLIAEPVHGNAIIIISWTSVASALGYRIWRSEGQTSAETEIGSQSHEFNIKYVDTKVKYGATYSYMVQTYDKTTKYGPKSNPIEVTVLEVTPSSSDRQKTIQETITHPVIDVRFGDLITETVDAIVVCLSSDELKNNVLKAAGHDESMISDNTHRRDGNNCFISSGGLLPCKSIIFVPWKGSTRSLDVLEQHIRDFVTMALQSAQQNKCKTVSFPAIGCGGLGYDVGTVAKTMVSEVSKQLATTLRSQMQISFVIHRDKQNIYDEFLQHISFTSMLPLDKENNLTSIDESTIPSTWQITNGAYNLRMNVSIESSEGQLVLSDFRRTMACNTYQSVIRIERIQNERWFRQYQIHKKDFNRRLREDTEQRLYHGCADGETAVKSIIEHGFNRSLAGTQHGIVFGLGVYFSSKASESHGYTKPSNACPTGERHMFVCNVLVGKTTQGNPSMRRCPSGFDSTSNGSTIYVIYHDAQAYAEYLIVYRA